MAYNAATLSSLNGFHKHIHAPKLEKLIPEDHHIFRDIPFQKGHKLGRDYLQPVHLTLPHGATFSASDAVPTLKAAIASQTKEATVDAYQIIMRERVGYDAADRAASSESAYENDMTFLMEGLRLSHASKAEALNWYGQDSSGLGTVASISTNTLTIPTSQWAPGIWQGGENLRLDVYTSTTYQKTVTVTAVDFDNLTVTVDNAQGISAADVLYFEGAYGNSQAGIHKIVTNTGSLFGIDASTYNLWKGITQTAGSTTLSFLTLMKAVAKARVKGFRGEADVYINPATFTDLVNQVEAARTDDQRKGMTVDRGADSFRVRSANGALNIKVSDFVKKGFAYGLVKDGSWKRIGSSDITFRYPGTDKEDFFIHLQEAAGYEFRSWSNYALFCARPGANFVINNIVNSD
jgi:hypothetical protein